MSVWGEITPEGAPLPNRLEDGASASWYIETKAVQQECRRRHIRYQERRACVTPSWWPDSRNQAERD
jgi:hypothetical protein